MTLKEFQHFFSEQLSDKYPKSEIDTFFTITIEEQLGLQRIDTILKPDLSINPINSSILRKIINRLQNEEPIQYIFGKTEFYGLPFLVNKHTLIPRPETEELVEWIILQVTKLQSYKVVELQSLNILEIGTGTGCIPISLKKNLPNTTITAIDVSIDALKVAQQNANLNNVEIEFFKVDILKTTSLNVIAKEERLKQPIILKKEMLKQVQYDKKFDIIVSNPPYVRELEKVEIKNNVLENEPHLALFVNDDDPLLFYNKIADLAKQHLSKNGLLFFEINQYLGAETVKLLQQKGFQNIELKKDFAGNNRMIKASLN